MYYLQQKYANSGDSSFDSHALRNQLAKGFWAFFGLYSVWWTFFLYRSRDTQSMASIDFATSLWFAIQIPVYINVGTKLIDSINTMLGYSENAPGVSQIQTIIRLQCTAMALRTFETSMPDIANIFDIYAISKSNPNWPAIMSMQCSIQLFACFVMFYSMYLLRQAETAITGDPNSLKARHGNAAATANGNLLVCVPADGSDLKVV